MALEPVTLAVDVGGSHIAIALVSKSQIIDKEIFKAEPNLGMKHHLVHIEEVAKELVRDQKLGFDDLSGIGMALPMIVDPLRQRVLSTASRKYEDATEIDFEEWSTKAFGLRIKLEVDGNAGILGEWYYGAGRGVQDLAYVVLGTGYGSAVVMRGKPMRGRNYSAGILGGHFVANINGNKCVCPGSGCVEAETGTWALDTIAKSMDGYHQSLVSKRDAIDYEGLFEDMKQGDAIASRLIRRSIKYWGASLVNLSLAYSPAKIILAGGILQAAGYIIPELNKYVRKQLWTPDGAPIISIAEFPEEAALRGIHVLVNESLDYL
ncbi:MAG: ROK family protein [Cyclobacteriaceae bacterium]